MKIFKNLLSFVVISVLLIVSCSKDIDSLKDAVLSDEDIQVSETSTTNDASNEQDEVVEVIDEVNEQSIELESRTTIFPSIQDAYIQNGQGYDQTIVRLQENHRTSYLMFDLSQIDSIEGKITSLNLEFIINTDDGSGTIEVFKGNSNSWTEDSLTNKNAPEPGVLIGSVDNEFYVDNKVSISLDENRILPEASTLILDHKNGDDLAFASKENLSDLGPRLVVNYTAPIDAKALEIEISQNIIEDTSEEPNSDQPLDEPTSNPEPEEPISNPEPESEGPSPEPEPEEPSPEPEPEEPSPEPEPEGPSPEPEPEEPSPEPEPEEPSPDPAPEEDSNEAPIAVAEALQINGTAPFEVNFKGDKSFDDSSVTSYSWNFKDGSYSNNTNPTHTFTSSGTYSVELTVSDAEGLTSSDNIQINVSAPVNNPPVAVASANIISGPAPLTVNFTGGNSSDDNGITTFRWEFKDGSSSTEMNNTHTFNSPGVYYVDLFVTDEQGLTDFAGILITVEEVNIVDNSCTTNGGYAHDTGLKTWCWGDINVPSGASSGKDSFSNGQLALNVECSANQVVREGDRLKFKLNPTSPSPASWCGNNYNMRSEIRTMPWQVNHPLGTEEWIGWSYTFGNNYVVDNNNPWLFFQMHQGVSGSPPFEFTVVPSSLYGAQNGEVVIINHANKTETDRTRTGVVPSAGTTLNIVVHVVHGLGSNGKLEVWINNNKVYDKQVGTVLAAAPWGGNAKFGIYKWPWREAAGVQNSTNQGITSLETYMGPLRIITRRPGDSNYGQNSFQQVVPR